MYCKHCGKEIDDNSSFCKYCGKPQDNRVSTPNSFIDFVYKKPILSSYILWVIINAICLSRGDKAGEYYHLLYPKFYIFNDYDKIEDCFTLDYYQLTDFIVWAILIPLVLFFGYHYFKKVTSINSRICWGIWFAFHLLMYKISDLSISSYFFPFTYRFIDFKNHISLFCYDAYDLRELVFYTMIIPIAYWGYLYYKDKKSAKNN